MFDPKILDNLAARLAESIPPGIRDVQQDLEKNFRGILQGAFAKMNLVTREEFDVQADLLARCRVKLAEMEKQIASLEARLNIHTGKTAE